MLERGVAHQALVCMQPCFLGGYRSLTRQVSAISASAVTLTIFYEPGSDPSLSFARQLARPAALEDISVASVGGDIIIHGSIQNDLRYPSRSPPPH